jgi:predicted dehydrogenase
MSHFSNSSRRDFLWRTALLGGAASIPSMLPQPALGSQRRFGPNDRIVVGVIGVGNRGNLLIDQLPAPGQIAAICDCDLQRCEQAVAKRSAKWDVYQDFRKILDRKDIDAVIVSTHDHGRVLPCILACQAGKDIYAEKPVSLHIGEGRELVKAVRKYQRILQVGTQQRSMEMNQIACKLVREGGLGRLKLVQGFNYASSKKAPALPAEPIPEKLDWDAWLGQTPMRDYNKTIRSRWMSWDSFSGGELTNWGAHGLDQIQWALGMDRSGPVELWPLAGGPEGSIAFRYANGVEVHLDLAAPNELMGGGRFIGEKGSIDIWRNNFKIDAPGVTLDLPPQEEIAKWHDKRALWQAQYHMKNWLDCIVSRQTPTADVEIGHRSVSLGHLANITRTLNRKLKWDPKKEVFRGDREANRLVYRPRRDSYRLPKV